MAQTMRLTLFGPLFIDSAHPVAYLVIRTYRHSKTLVSIEKKRKKRKNNSPRAQMTPDASFGPVSVVPAQSVVYLVIRT